MNDNASIMAPQELIMAAADAHGAGIDLHVGVVFTIEQQDWAAVHDWHTESHQSLVRKLADTATITSLGSGRMLVFSSKLTQEQLGHNIRSALGFADLPTRIGLSSLPEHGNTADALIHAAFTNAVK